MVRGWRIEAVRFHRRERREWGQVLISDSCSQIIMMMPTARGLIGG